MSSNSQNLSVNSITVKLGGERLYVHPISYKPETIFSFRSYKRPLVLRSELKPYDDGFLTYGCMAWQAVGPLSKLDGWLRPRLVAVWEILAFNFQRRGLLDRIRKWRWWWRPIGYYTAVLGHEIFHGRISLPHNLELIDPEEITDTYYLIPSQKWIKSQLEAWVIEQQNDTDSDWGVFRREEASEFLAWINEQQELGREIQYLVSLDT